ncbi:hypothetical protein J6590_004474 [Homalodisca vitripennis]|nr:hypothetical protein J6590_004474 [Homalodisca vitripennis]
MKLNDNLDTCTLPASLLTNGGVVLLVTSSFRQPYIDCVSCVGRPCHLPTGPPSSVNGTTIERTWHLGTPKFGRARALGGYPALPCCAQIARLACSQPELSACRSSRPSPRLGVFSSRRPADS